MIPVVGEIEKATIETRIIEIVVPTSGTKANRPTTTARASAYCESPTMLRNRNATAAASATTRKSPDTYPPTRLNISLAR